MVFFGPFAAAPQGADAVPCGLVDRRPPKAAPVMKMIKKRDNNSEPAGTVPLRLHIRRNGIRSGLAEAAPGGHIRGDLLPIHRESARIPKYSPQMVPIASRLPEDKRKTCRDKELRLF